MAVKAADSIITTTYCAEEQLTSFQITVSQLLKSLCKQASDPYLMIGLMSGGIFASATKAYCSRFFSSFSLFQKSPYGALAIQGISSLSGCVGETIGFHDVPIVLRGEASLEGKVFDEGWRGWTHTFLTITLLKTTGYALPMKSVIAQHLTQDFLMIGLDSGCAWVGLTEVIAPVPLFEQLFTNEIMNIQMMMGGCLARQVAPSVSIFEAKAHLTYEINSAGVRRSKLSFSLSGWFKPLSVEGELVPAGGPPLAQFCRTVEPEKEAIAFQRTLLDSVKEGSLVANNPISRGEPKVPLGPLQEVVVVIGNRGEAATRAARTSIEKLDLPTVIIHSAADQNSTHTMVEGAAKVINIGGETAAESYNNIEKIVSALEEVKADPKFKNKKILFWPGWGFKAEDPALVRAVEEAGSVFVGPSAEAMELLGLKVQANEIAKRAGLKPVPASGVTTCIEEGWKAYEEISEGGKQVVMIKGDGTGGGKGIRIIRNQEEFEQQYLDARREAEATSGNPNLFIAKYIPNPHHIEAQLIVDCKGNVRVIGIRRNSLQRKSQKVVEEDITALLPKRVYETIVEQCQAGIVEVKKADPTGKGYIGAATVEFLWDKSRDTPWGEFTGDPKECLYFLEVNTRLQVEHCVTEEAVRVKRKGKFHKIDLVELQLRIAAGEILPFSQEELVHPYVVREIRLCAEVPDEGFRSDPGRVTHFSYEEGVNRRVDSGIEESGEVSPHYDSMVAKAMASYKVPEPSLLSRMASRTFRATFSRVIKRIRKIKIPFLNGEGTNGSAQNRKEGLFSKYYRANLKSLQALAFTINLRGAPYQPSRLLGYYEAMRAHGARIFAKLAGDRSPEEIRQIYRGMNKELIDLVESIETCGIRTNKDWLLRLLKTPEVDRGEGFHTKFIEEEFLFSEAGRAHTEDWHTALVSSAVATYATRRAILIDSLAQSEKLPNNSKIEMEVAGHEFEVEVKEAGEGRFWVRSAEKVKGEEGEIKKIGEKTVLVGMSQMGKSPIYTFNFKGETRRMIIDSKRGSRIVTIGDKEYEVKVGGEGILGKEYVKAKSPSKIIKLHVKKGQEVKEGQVIATVESMKMQLEIRAEVGGIVGEIFTQEGETIQALEPILKVESSGEGGAMQTRSLPQTKHASDWRIEMLASGNFDYLNLESEFRESLGLVLSLFQRASLGFDIDPPLLHQGAAFLRALTSELPSDILAHRNPMMRQQLIQGLRGIFQTFSDIQELFHPKYENQLRASLPALLRGEAAAHEELAKAIPLIAKQYYGINDLVSSQESAQLMFYRLLWARQSLPRTRMAFASLIELSRELKLGELKDSISRLRTAVYEGEIQNSLSSYAAEAINVFEAERAALYGFAAKLPALFYLTQSPDQPIREAAISEIEKAPHAALERYVLSILDQGRDITLELDYLFNRLYGGKHKLEECISFEDGIAVGYFREGNENNSKDRAVLWAVARNAEEIPAAIARAKRYAAELSLPRKHRIDNVIEILIPPLSDTTSLQNPRIDEAVKKATEGISDFKRVTLTMGRGTKAEPESTDYATFRPHGPNGEFVRYKLHDGVHPMLAHRRGYDQWEHNFVPEAGPRTLFPGVTVLKVQNKASYGKDPKKLPKGVVVDKRDVVIAEVEGENSYQYFDANLEIHLGNAFGKLEKNSYAVLTAEEIAAWQALPWALQEAGYIPADVNPFTLLEGGAQHLIQRFELTKHKIIQVAQHLIEKGRVCGIPKAEEQALNAALTLERLQTQQPSKEKTGSREKEDFFNARAEIRFHEPLELSDQEIRYVIVKAAKPLAKQPIDKTIIYFSRTNPRTGALEDFEGVVEMAAGGLEIDIIVADRNPHAVLSERRKRILTAKRRGRYYIHDVPDQMAKILATDFWPPGRAPKDVLRYRELILDEKGELVPVGEFRLPGEQAEEKGGLMVAYEAIVKYSTDSEGKNFREHPIIFTGNNVFKVLGTINQKAARVYTESIKLAKERGVPIIHVSESGGAQMGPFPEAEFGAVRKTPKGSSDYLFWVKSEDLDKIITDKATGRSAPLKEVVTVGEPIAIQGIRWSGLEPKQEIKGRVKSKKKGEEGKEDKPLLLRDVVSLNELIFFEVEDGSTVKGIFRQDPKTGFLSFWCSAITFNSPEGFGKTKELISKIPIGKDPSNNQSILFGEVTNQQSKPHIITEHRGYEIGEVLGLNYGSTESLVGSQEMARETSLRDIPMIMLCIEGIGIETYVDVVAGDLAMLESGYLALTGYETLNATEGTNFPDTRAFAGAKIVTANGIVHYVARTERDLLAYALRRVGLFQPEKPRIEVVQTLRDPEFDLLLGLQNEDTEDRIPSVNRHLPRSQKSLNYFRSEDPLTRPIGEDLRKACPGKNRPYDEIALLRAFLDKNPQGEPFTVQDDYGRTLRTGFGRLGGIPIAFIVPRTQLTEQEIAAGFRGGTLDFQSADKFERWLELRDIDGSIILVIPSSAFMSNLQNVAGDKGGRPVYLGGKGIVDRLARFKKANILPRPGMSHDQKKLLGKRGLFYIGPYGEWQGGSKAVEGPFVNRDNTVVIADHRASIGVMAAQGVTRLNVVRRPMMRMIERDSVVQEIDLQLRQPISEKERVGLLKKRERVIDELERSKYGPMYFSFWNKHLNTVTRDHLVVGNVDRVIKKDEVDQTRLILATTVYSMIGLDPRDLRP